LDRVEETRHKVQGTRYKEQEAKAFVQFVKFAYPKRVLYIRVNFCLKNE